MITRVNGMTRLELIDRIKELEIICLDYANKLIRVNFKLHDYKVGKNLIIRGN